MKWFVFLGFVFEHFQVHAQNPVEGNLFLDRYGDAVAWGGCTILYLLGQQLRFELLDFTYHVLSVTEAEALPSPQLSLAEKSKSSYPSLVKKNKIHKLLCLSPFNTSIAKMSAHAYSFENFFF
jgi:hypothetical protein